MHTSVDVVFQVSHAKLTFNSKLGDAVWARKSTDMGLQRQIVDADYLASKQGRRSVCAANVINPSTKTKSRNRFDAGSLKMLFVSQNNHQTNETLFLYVESV